MNVLDRKWFGPALAAAQHQDDIASWPWWARWLHRTFRAQGCPACIYWKRKGAPDERE